MKKPLKIFLFFLLAFILVIALSESRTQSISEKYIFAEILEIPNTKVGLVLGTSKYIADGRRNLFYLYRLDAAKALYDAGKIEYILVSGDNGSVNYNETDTMKTDLVAMGIPEERIYGDYAGFRTLDSVVRAREIFGQERYIIITQTFHLQRALYLAHHE
jgi:SanA protein